MLKDLAKRALQSTGYTVSRLNRPIAAYPPVDPRVRAFVESMRPVKVGYGLIRAGGAGDGAYLVPDDLDGIAALFSPGVDQVAQFEADMADRGMRCYLADASVAKPPVDDDRFDFEGKFLGLVDDGVTSTLDSWVNRKEPGTHDLMLQMDIEGAEWGVLANASTEVLSRFRILIVEFHSLSRMFDDFGAQVMTDVFHRLALSHHVVHVHPNNVSYVTTRDGVDLPELIEVTYLRKDRSAVLGHADRFPHPLDVVNVRELPPLTLPTSWYERHDAQMHA